MVHIRNPGNGTFSPQLDAPACHDVPHAIFVASALRPLLTPAARVTYSMTRSNFLSDLCFKPVLDNSGVVSKDKPRQIIAWNNSKETGRDNDMSQSRRDQDRGWATHYKQRHKTSSEYRVKNRIVT